MDLKDGETTEMQGSGKKPYILKNVGGVYSCSCPAWRNQSLPIEQRSCKHIVKLRGEVAEKVRVGSAAEIKPEKAAKDVPDLLLAHSWDGVQDISNWWLSEKLDGVRAYWDGNKFISRQGNVFHAPDWFSKGLPSTPLDGELWIARKQFQRTSGLVRRQDKSDHWKEIKYIMFDAPARKEVFEMRQAYLLSLATEYAKPIEQSACKSIDHLKTELARLESLGAEGVMLRQPLSYYEGGRSQTLLKVKSFKDEDATVIDYEKGKGRHKNRIGSLICKLKDGTVFSVGTGLSDKERDNPPKLGDVIIFRYQELTDSGVPRFASFVGIRAD